MDLECTEVASHQGPGEAEAWRRLRSSTRCRGLQRSEGLLWEMASLALMGSDELPGPNMLRPGCGKNRGPSLFSFQSSVLGGPALHSPNRWRMNAFCHQEEDCKALTTPSKQFMGNKSGAITANQCQVQGVPPKATAVTEGSSGELP